MLENHVPSLELCRRWKELGGRQNTLFHWRIPYTGKAHVTDKSMHKYCYGECAREWIAAPTVGEMMEWGKLDIAIVWFKEKKHGVSLCDDKWVVESIKTMKEFYDDSLPNALMQMCIARKEEEDGKG